MKYFQIPLIILVALVLVGSAATILLFYPVAHEESPQLLFTQLEENNDFSEEDGVMTEQENPESLWSHPNVTQEDMDELRRFMTGVRTVDFFPVSDGKTFALVERGEAAYPWPFEFWSLERSEQWGIQGTLLQSGEIEGCGGVWGRLITDDLIQMGVVQTPCEAGLERTDYYYDTKTAFENLRMEFSSWSGVTEITQSHPSRRSMRVFLSFDGTCTGSVQEGGIPPTILFKGVKVYSISGAFKETTHLFPLATPKPVECSVFYGGEYIEPTPHEPIFDGVRFQFKTDIPYLFTVHLNRLEGDSDFVTIEPLSE